MSRWKQQVLQNETYEMVYWPTSGDRVLDRVPVHGIPDLLQHSFEFGLGNDPRVLITSSTICKG